MDRNKTFRNKLGKPYMRKTSFGAGRVNESEYDELVDQIGYAVKKLNSIRIQCKEFDPDYDEDLLDIDELDMTERTLDNLQDAIENERQLLDIYRNDAEDMEDEPYDEEPTEEDLDRMRADDSDIFDDPTEFVDDEFADAPADNARFDDESDESRFIAAMTDQMKKGEDERGSFWLVLKSQPDVDYEAKVITKFKDDSFIFTILTIDGEEFNQDRKIALSDIDLEATDYSDLV